MIDSKNKPRIIHLDKIIDHRGNLSVVEQFKEIPFDIKRVYWVYDVPAGEYRGGHAHRSLSQFIVAAGGSFYVNTDDGKEKKTFFLNHPYTGLFIPPGIWRTLDDFSSGALVLVMASDFFDENDYIRDYSEFLDYTKEIL